MHFVGRCDVCRVQGQTDETLADGQCYNLDTLHWQCPCCGCAGFVPDSIGWPQNCHLNISFRKHGSSIQSISSNNVSMSNPVNLNQMVFGQVRSISITPSTRPFLEDLSRSADRQIYDRLLIVHGHSSLPKSAPAKIPKGFMLCSYTEPGTPIYSCQTLKVLKALESGCLLNSVSSVKEADDVRLRMNTDATPNYSISFNGSHNNYEAQTAPYSLGLWLYDSTSTPRLQPIPWSDRMNMVEAFHYATEHRINRVMIFGCKGGELAQ